MTTMTSLYISTPKMTVLLIIEYGKVREAPPIMKWAIGKTQEEIEHIYYKAGAEMFEVEYDT